MLTDDGVISIAPHALAALPITAICGMACMDGMVELDVNSFFK